MNKCMINHGFCELHMCDLNDMGKCPVGEVSTVCCTFHDAGGSPDLCCGGDVPNTGGKHLRSCAYHGGGDCTCGRGNPEPLIPYCSITGADMTPKGPDMNSCPCCGWHLINGECNACGQKVTQPFPGMCEVCGERAAEKGDFICMECISRMLIDME